MDMKLDWSTRIGISKRAGNEADVHQERGLAPLVDFSSLGFHRFMLANADKYRVFFDVFKRTIAGKTVIEVGSGTGVLSILAAASGAKSVVGYERVGRLHAISEWVAGHSGISENVLRFVHADFLERQPDLAGVDVVFSENVGYMAFEERILEIANSVHSSRKRGSNRPEFWPKSMMATAHPIEAWPKRLPYQAVLSPGSVGNSESMKFVVVAPQEISLSSEIREISSECRLRVVQPVVVTGVHITVRARIWGRHYIGNEVTACWPRLYVPIVPALSARAGEELRIRLPVGITGESACIHVSVFNHARGQGASRVVTVNRPLSAFVLPEDSGRQTKIEALRVVRTLLGEVTDSKIL